MGAIWHETNSPGWLAAGPQFSFQDIAEIHIPAPTAYEDARQRLMAWERRVGAAYLQHHAEIAWQNWQRKKPWWLSL